MSKDDGRASVQLRETRAETVQALFSAVLLIYD